MDRSIAGQPPLPTVPQISLLFFFSVIKYIPEILAKGKQGEKEKEKIHTRIHPNKYLAPCFDDIRRGYFTLIADN